MDLAYLTHSFSNVFFQHMIKYKYIPFTVGKPRMAGKEDTGKLLDGNDSV
ncbi:hypothetical protein GCK32_021185 [Trichostrongylus colubriformis]|uniref:Uncharacterized protein n=1 Tax=Trichostrongylus colubriformis TaxID=6319 RepID=A0AAN8FGQ9_TRICO